MSAEPGETVGVVGASARAATFSLLRAGYKVVAADLFADADLARCCAATRIESYPEGFAQWLARTKCDYWIYTGALENYPELVDQLAEIRPLLGCSGDQLKRVRDPLQLQELLRQADFCFPETIAAPADLPREEHWLGKTYQGSSGQGVGPTDGAPYYQRRVSGTPLSAVFHGNKLRGVTRQLVGEAWSGAAEFQYCGSIGPWPLPTGCAQQLHRLGELLCEAFHLVGWYGVDLIASDKQMWIVEVNPRFTAAVEIVERAQAVAGSCFGKVIHFAKRPLTIDAQLSDALLDRSGRIAWPALADIPAADSQIATGQPILTSFATDVSPEAVHAKLQHRVDELEQTLNSGAHVC